LKKAVNVHNVIVSVELLNQHHSNAVINLQHVPDPGIEETIRPELLQGPALVALVVSVLGFLWKLLLQKALVLVRRDRKLRRDSGDLVLMLQVWELVGGIPAGPRWIIDLPGLTIVANDAPGGRP
jgi:hypothetical protein